MQSRVFNFFQFNNTTILHEMNENENDDAMKNIIH
jgi:hypothetical protein